MFLFKSAAIISFLTLLSRISGLARELYIASLFGTSATADIVNTAFKLPNLFRRLFGEGALSSVFIPLFNEHLTESREKAKIFAQQILIMLVCILLFLLIFFEIFMPQLIMLITPGFDFASDNFHMAVLLSRITMPYLVFVCIIALMGGILNSLKSFFPYAFMPILFNIALVFFTNLLAKFNISYSISFSFSVTIAGIIQMIFMYICLRRVFPLSLFSSFCLDLYKRKEIKFFFTNLLPAITSSGSSQLHIFISHAIASFVKGGISILSYAERIYQFPLSIISISFSTVLLPYLSKLYSKKMQNKIDIIQNNSVAIALILSVPSMLGMIILARPIVHVIYEYGAFNAEDTYRTAQTISAFAFGLPAFILSKILLTIFYADKNTKTPLKITLKSLILNLVLNILLVNIFNQTGIAAASSIAAWYNLFLLYRDSKNTGKFVILPFLVKTIYRIFIASFSMAIFLMIILKFYSSYFYSNILFVKFFALAMTITLAIIIFAIVCYFLKIHKNLILN